MLKQVNDFFIHFFAVFILIILITFLFKCFVYILYFILIIYQFYNLIIYVKKCHTATVGVQALGALLRTSQDLVDGQI